MSRKARSCALAALAALLAAGCGGGLEDSPIEVRIKDEDGQRGVLGFPLLATKNTTRIAGKDPVEDAAAAALAAFPGGGQRPPAVALVNKGNAQAGIAAAVLTARPIRAPVLLTDDDGIPDATADALRELRPRGSPLFERTQAFRVGDAAAPEDLRTQRIFGKDAFDLAATIDAFAARARGRQSRSVVVAPAEDPRFAMPAAAWAAKSGDSVLFVRRDALPPVTRQAIIRHRRPRIYVLGPASLISRAVVRRLEQLGTVTRIAAATPAENAIAFARYSDPLFGWGVRDPGHGLVIANWNRPLDAAAAAPLSSSGTYGPLLLTDSAGRLPVPLRDFLLDIQPGYRADPVRGVYNHAWLLGDESAMTSSVQARIDQSTEIVRVDEPASAP